MYKYIYKVGDVCFSSFEEATKVIDKAFKFNKPITIERYKLFDSYDDLYDIAVVENTNPRARYSSDFEESIAKRWQTYINRHVYGYGRSSWLERCNFQR